MKYNKTYMFTIGKPKEPMRLKQSSNGQNAIAAIDTDVLGGSLYDLKESKNLSINSYIKLVRETIRGTEFKSNSVDVLITDVYDEHKNPLYYKAIIRRDGYESVYIGGHKITVLDDVFMYTNITGDVTFKYSDGTEETIEEEFYPVYVNHSDASLRQIEVMDNKFFELGLGKNGDFSIFVKGSNLSYKTKDNAVLKIKQFNTNDRTAINLYVGPYFYESKVQDQYREYHLQYRKTAPNQIIVKNKSELVRINGDYIVLQKNNIADYDIELSLVDSVGRVIKRIDNTDNIFNHKSVYLRRGLIYSPDIISYLSQYEFSQIVASYSYVKYTDNNISIPVDMLDDLDYISVGITPEITSIDGNVLRYSDTIKYFVFNKLGYISFQNGASSLSSYQRIVGYGFGEHGYGEYGYSGHILKPGAIEQTIRTAVKTYDKSGYSENHYSFGPFGGASINTPEGLFNISLDGNSPVGYIELCKIRKKDLSNLPVVLNNRLSIPRKESHGLRLIHEISNSVFNVHVGEPKGSFLNAGVIEISAPNSTNGTLAIYTKDAVNTILEFRYDNDISKQTPQYVTDPKALSFKKDTSLLNKSDPLKYKIYGYVNNAWEEITLLAKKKIDDQNIIYFKIDNAVLSKYQFIGPAYANSTPGRKIKI